MHPKYIIAVFSLALSSCGNKPNDIVESFHSNKPVDNISQVNELLNIDSMLHITWAEFQKAVITKDYKRLKRLSFDSLKCCDTIFSFTKFTEKYFTEVFDTALTNKFSIPNNNNVIEMKMERSYFSDNILKAAVFNDDIITLTQFQIKKALTADGAWTMTFDFIKTQEGYKFFGCDSYGGPICCH